MSVWTRLGLAGAGVGVAAAGTAVAVSTRQRRLRVDPQAPPPAERTSTVAADDGVPLAVEEVGEPDAPLTVVLVHGFCLDQRSWTFQRAALAAPDVRVVTYDQRGHGRSGTGRGSACTIDQLGHDLQTVLRTVVPTSPVVLVGHSMGGMTVMAVARQLPELFTDRVAGVALVSTASDGLSLRRFGLGAGSPLVGGMRRVGRLRPDLLALARSPLNTLVGPLVKAMSYGDRHTDPAVVRFSEELIAATPVRTIVDFIPTLSDHDERDALPVLAGRPVLVLCGDDDRLTPLRHTRVIADVLTEADLVVADGAGHLVQLERPGLVNEALLRLVERAVGWRPGG